MLFRRGEDGELTKIQLSHFPQCALFTQEIKDGVIHVKYLTPEEPLVPKDDLQNTTLEVPLKPEIGDLEKEEVNVHNSMVYAYRMGKQFDDWFSSCFGFDTVLVYIGDGKRPILGTFSPKTQAQPSSGWLSSITSMVTGGSKEEADWLNFSDCAPYLIATEASLANVHARLPDNNIDIVKFRPNIVVDGEGEWDEDFWSSLSLNGVSMFTLSKLCGRCNSVNVDYKTGKVAQGEEGTVLKKLMSDRRVDPGHKYSPVFGRYGFLTKEREKEGGLTIQIGDEMGVEARNQERPTWDWPMKDKSQARFYGQPVQA